MRNGGSVAPWIVALVLLAALAVVVVVATPWHPFGEQQPDFVAAEPGRDFSPAEQEAAAAYRGDVRPPAYLSLATGLVAALVLGLTPLGARLVEAAARPLGGGWVWQVLLGGLALLLVVRAATLPFGAWAEGVRQDYGISTRTWGGWLSDVGRSFGLQAVGTLLAVLALVALARAVSGWWWVPAAAGAAVAVVVLSFVYPLVVEPVFNRFTPMEDGELRESLLELADESDVEVEDVLVADASRRTTTLNAYVSGFGATHRIVVYDNLVRQAPPEEVRSVVAHELGHTVERDVRDGTLLGALAAAAGVCLLAGLLSWRPLLDRAGADGPGDPRVLALVLAVVAVLSLLASPVENLISRRVETRADVHALDLTRDPATFTRMQRNLALTSYADLDPPPVVYAFFASHPTTPQRIALARTWAVLHGEAVPADQAGGS